MMALLRKEYYRRKRQRPRTTTTNSVVAPRTTIIIISWPALLLLLLLVLLHCVSSAWAWIPPRPGTDLAKSYEPVDLYRQLHNLTFGYNPQALHPELCRYLTEEECQHHDQSMQRHQQRHRNLQRHLFLQRKRKRRRELLIMEKNDDDDDDESNISSHYTTENHPQNLRGSSKSSSSSSSSIREQPTFITENNMQFISERDDDMEFHQAEFRRLLTQFTKEYQDYTPTREEELQELQSLLVEHNQTLDEAIARQLQREPLPEEEEEDEEELPQAAATGRNPRIGTFNVLVLLMRFTDHASRNLPKKFEYQILWNLRINKWLQVNSYGQYSAFFDVQPWQTTDNSEKYYSFGKSGRVAQFQESYWPLLNKLDNDPNWDWKRFDQDGNGLLDNLIVLHSGYAAEEGGQDCSNGREFQDRIWSHAFSDSNGWRNAAGTYGVEGYMIASALDLTCDSQVAKMGVMTHEYLHTFYLMDLYDYTFEGNGVGMFDIMAYPYGISNTGYLPLSMSAYAKASLDWLDCEVVTTSSKYTLQPAATTASCLKIMLLDKFDSKEFKDEYLLLENRQQVGFDVHLWQSGVVIYHIDDAANQQYDRGFPGQPGNWPYNGKHYQVAVVQADKNFDLEKGNNLGDEGDLFVVGDVLEPNYDGKIFPNTDIYQGGKVQKTGVRIEILSQEGLDYKLKIDLGERSGMNDDSSSAKPQLTPPKEEDNGNHNDESESAASAKEQFQVPDSTQHQISGMIPHLPWYHEQKESAGQHGEDGFNVAIWDSGDPPFSSASNKKFPLCFSAILLGVSVVVMSLTA